MSFACITSFDTPKFLGTGFLSEAGKFMLSVMRNRCVAFDMPCDVIYIHAKTLTYSTFNFLTLLLVTLSLIIHQKGATGSELFLSLFTFKIHVNLTCVFQHFSLITDSSFSFPFMVAFLLVQDPPLN